MILFKKNKYKIIQASNLFKHIKIKIKYFIKKKHYIRDRGYSYAIIHVIYKFQILIGLHK